MLPLCAMVDLGAITVKGYSTFPKAPSLLEPHHQIVSIVSRVLIGDVLPICRVAVGVFYIPCRMGNPYASCRVYVGINCFFLFSFLFFFLENVVFCNVEFSL